MAKILRFAVIVVAVAMILILKAPAQETPTPFQFKKGDRIAWVGSSSTNIGVWPKTMEFLLRTRRPDLDLSFKKFSTGGGTFATGVQNLDKWLDDFKPTVVVFNYGSNDAGAGEKGVPILKENIVKCVAKVESAKARVLFSAFQGADVRKAGELPAARRKLYAETLIAFCKEKGWPIVDVYHPIDALQSKAQQENEKYTILRDKIHLTDPAYIAWGFYLYDGLGITGGVNDFAVDAVKLKPIAEVGCKVIRFEQEKPGAFRFTRVDYVLPYLPPGTLPPAKFVPLEKHSAYRLRMVGLQAGDYEIFCQGKLLGLASHKELGAGINLNSLVLRNGVTAPWEALTKEIWQGKELDKIDSGRTRWEWRIVRK